jgi:hypothetical protein
MDGLLEALQARRQPHGTRLYLVRRGIVHGTALIHQGLRIKARGLCGPQTGAFRALIYFWNFEIFSRSQPATDRVAWPVNSSTVDVVSASADW